MDPVTMAAIMGGTQLLGGILNNNSQQHQQQMQGLMRAAEIKASHWTKMGPSTQVNFAPTAASGVIGNAVGGAAGGLALAQNQEAADAQRKFQQAQMENQAAQASMWSKLAAQPPLMSSAPTAAQNYWGSTLKSLE